MRKTLEDAIKTGDWSDEVLNKFENLIKEKRNEKINSERSMGEGRNFSSSKSEIHEGASLLSRTVGRTVSKERRNSQTEYDIDAKEGKEQERIIESWAKAADLWLNDYTDPNGKKANTLEDLLNSQWKYWNQGSEAEVYKYNDSTVLKSINLSHTNDYPSKLLDRIATFNLLFPATAMEVVGFGRDSLGHFRIIVTQPHIQGTELTDEDLKDFHTKAKLEQYGGWFRTGYPGVRITDLSPSNIIKDAEGNYFIIDADISFSEEAKQELTKTSTDEINKGDLSGEQIASVGRGISEIIGPTSEGVQQSIRRISDEIQRNSRNDKRYTGLSTLGVSSKQQV